MILDFTKETALSGKYLRVYIVMRLLLFVVFIAAGVYFLSLLFFPTQYFQFSFENQKAKSNTITGVTVNGANNFKNGLITKNQALAFTASSPGFFSKAVVRFELDKKSPKLSAGTVSVRKTFQAFFYPEGDAREIEEYLRERTTQSIGDGSLVSYGGSIYAISGNQILPIDSPETFLGLGYAWESIVPADADQFSRYEKGSLLTIYSMHPDGTVFQTFTGEKFFIKGGKKYRLSEAFENIKINPVAVSTESITVKSNCLVEKNKLFLRKYGCEVSLENIRNFFGKDYVFSADSGSKIKIKNIAVELKRDWTAGNFKYAFNNLIRRSKENYVSEN